jgi:hypothetical protein
VAGTGFYTLSRGLRTCIGPLLAGIAITALDGVFVPTHGYRAVWSVFAAAALLSLVPLRWLASLREA